ncbi:MAG: PAS domain-containing protein, partial [Sneathiella sp.]
MVLSNPFSSTKRKKTEVDALSVLNALPDPLIVIDEEGYLCMTNPAAEEFFGLSSKMLLRMSINEIVPFDSPLLGLVE